MRQQPFFEPRQVDGVELQALGAVQRHQRDGYVFLILIGIRCEGGAVEQIFERLALFGGFGHGVGKFAKILGAGGVLEVVLLLHPVEQAGAVQHAFNQRRGGQFPAEILEQFDQFAERIQRAGNLFPRRNVAAANRFPERLAGFLRSRFQRRHACRSDSARRHVQHAQQRDVIFGMENQPHVGEGVANFGALVKTESADHAVPDAQSPQDLLKRTRLSAGAIQDRHAGVGILANLHRQLAANVFRLRARIRRLEISQPVARAERRLESLAESVGIVLHHRGRGVENRLRRAVVFLQADDLCAREILGEALQVSRARPAPAVNRLIFVADHADILPRARQQVHQLFLRRVCVLKLVHHQILKLIAPALAHVAMLPQQLHGPQQQIVEIQRRGLAQQVVVGAENFRRVLAPAVAHVLGLGLHFVGSDAVILRVADLRPDAAWRIVFRGQPQRDQRALHRRGLVVVVVDREIPRQAQVLRLAPQQPRAERMKGRHPHIPGRVPARAQQLLNAVFHHARGFVGEGDRQNRARRHALLDQMRHAIGDHARLARACAGQDQQRSFRRQHSFTLAFVQSRKSAASSSESSSSANSS